MSQTNEKQHYTDGIRRARLMLGVFAATALVIGLVGAYFSNDDPQMPQNPPSHRIEYQVSGTSTQVDVRYLNDMAYTETRSGTPPWRFGFRATQGRNLHVVVENRGEGTIGCAITASGKDIVRVPEAAVPSIQCTAQVP
jgi:hypothetical protein